MADESGPRGGPLASAAPTTSHHRMTTPTNAAELNTSIVSPSPTPSGSSSSTAATSPSSDRASRASGASAKGKSRISVDVGLRRVGTTNVSAIIAAVPEAPPAYGKKYTKEIESNGRFLLDFLLRADGFVGDLDDVSRQQKLSALQSGQGISLLEQHSFWVAVLHTRALSSSGMITRPNHVNVPSSTRVAAPSPSHSTRQNDEDDEDAPPSAEELLAIEGLAPPPRDCKPLSLSTLLRLLRVLQDWLAQNELPQVPQQTLDSTRRLLSYNATHKGYYPTARNQRLWLPDIQSSHVKAALWYERRVPGGIFATITRLSRQLLVQLMDESGVRARSWADYRTREVGEMGIYLRWGRVIFRLLGWDEDGPIFIVFGSASATKKRFPRDADAAQFAFGTRRGAAGDDPTLTMALLAIKSGAYDPALEKALTDKAFCEELLRGRPYKDFAATAAAEDSPVMVEYSTKPLKHADDRAAPALPGDKLRPLVFDQKNGWLVEAGWRAGLEGKLGVRVLRRSHCIKLVLHGEMSSHDIEFDMQHQDGQGHLQRRVYTAEIPPSMHIKRRSSRWQPSIVNDGMQNLHAIPLRPNAANIADDVLADLAAKVEALDEIMTRSKGGDRNDAHADDDEGEEGRLSAEDIGTSTEGRELVEAYSAIACGASYTWQEAFLNAKNVLQDARDVETDFEHPFVAAGGTLAACLAWLADCEAPPKRRRSAKKSGEANEKERVPDRCVACGEAAHTTTWGSTATSWRDVDDCICRREGLRLCPLCGWAFEEDERDEHLAAECFEAWRTRMVAAKGSITTDDCRVDVPSVLPSLFTKSYLCPFVSCVEGCEGENDWLQAIKRTTRGMPTFTVMINDIPIIKSVEGLTQHLYDHVVGRDGHLRLPIDADGDVVCGWVGCSTVFDNTAAGHLCRLQHLHCGHKMTIFVNEKGERIESLPRMTQVPLQLGDELRFGFSHTCFLENLEIHPRVRKELGREALTSAETVIARGNGGGGGMQGCAVL